MFTIFPGQIIKLVVEYLVNVLENDRRANIYLTFDQMKA